MIKRDGVVIETARNKNALLAKEIIAVCKNKQYTSLNGSIIDISSSLEQAVKGTVLYEDPLPLGKMVSIKPTIEIVNEKTSEAALRLLSSGKSDLVALNFASARNPGGGFLAGAQAQEEDLCRASGLYPCIKNKPMYYNRNILCDDSYYTDSIIYSPNVPFFKDKHNLFLEEPYHLSIISAPAPNVSGMKQVDEMVLAEKLLSRATKILQIAYKHGHKNLILGAWGCGAFGNEPLLVANVFMSALETVPAFEHVCFPIYDTRDGTPIFESFKQVINENNS